MTTLTERGLIMIEETVNVAEAKKHFSELLGRVAYGNQQIVITKRGSGLSHKKNSILLIHLDNGSNHASQLISIIPSFSSALNSGSPVSRRHL